MGIYSMNFRTCWGSRENKTSSLEKETLAYCWVKSCDSFSIVMLKFPLQYCYKKLLQPTDFGAVKKFTFVWSFLQNCFSLVTSWHRSEIDCFNSAIASRNMQKASEGLSNVLMWIYYSFISKMFPWFTFKTLECQKSNDWRIHWKGLD